MLLYHERLALRLSIGYSGQIRLVTLDGMTKAFEQVARASIHCHCE